MDSTNKVGKKEDFESLYEHVKDMRQSAEAIGSVLMQIKDNDVSFNERLLSLETKYQKDINELSDKLSTFYQDLDEMKTTIRQIGETQNVIQSTLVSDKFSKPLRRRNSYSRKNSNSDEGIHRNLNSNGVSGEEDSGVNLGAPICSSTNSDHGSNRSQNCGADPEFVKERINQFIEAASSLCNNSIPDSNNGDDFSSYDNKPWPLVNSKVLLGGPLENLRAIRNDSSENYRYEICMEIVQCERELCNAISTLQVYYYEPLKYSNGINSKDLSLMFPNELFRIYEQHCTILHRVQEIMNDYNCDSCELLLDVYFKVFEPRGYLICLYADYLSAYPQTMKLVTEILNDSSDYIQFLIRHQSSSGFNQRQKIIRSSSLHNYLAAPVKMIQHYNDTFMRLLETETLPESVMESLKCLLETLKYNSNDDQVESDDCPVLQRLPLTPPLKPKSFRSKQVRKIVQNLQHSSSDAIVQPFEKKAHFERHNCSSVSKKHQKLRMTYSGSEVNLQRVDSNEMKNDIGSPNLSTQLDAISEPSIFHDIKQANSGHEPFHENGHATLMSSQSHQMLARTDAYGSLSGSVCGSGDSSTFAKRNRNSLSKQVGGLRNSVAAFFSKRKNEKRFSDFDSTSMNFKSKKALSKNNLHFLNTSTDAGQHV